VSALDLFDAAAECPNATSVICDGRSYSYAELAAYVAGTSVGLGGTELLAAGPRPLAVALRPNLRGLVVLHACVAQGVPLLVVDPRLPAGEREALALRANARAIVLADELRLTQSGDGALVRPPSSPDPALPLAIVPTSGSTGRAKLVVLSRGAFVAAAAASATNLPLTPEDRWLLCLPLAHVGGLSIAVRCLLARAAVVAFDPHPRGLLGSTRELALAILEQRATLLSVVPTLLEALLELEPAWSPPPTLRAVLVGGAALPVPLLRRAEARGIPVLSSYGLTEACSQVATTPFGSPPRVAGSRVSAGRVLAPLEVMLDAEQRLLVRGPTLTSGYLDAPSPLDEAGWFRTEDRAFIDEEGELFVLGRDGDRIVTGGEKVDPRRVEAVLLEAPAVRDAFVFGVDDARFGQVVATALATEPGFDAEACAHYASARLAPHERPRSLACFPTFPLLVNGKLDRQNLRALALATLVSWPAMSVKRES
jgi:O-succinylbenzoic acid--CoA ligase